MNAYDHAVTLVRHAGMLEDFCIIGGATTSALCKVNDCMVTLQEISIALVEQGVREGLTQKRMADCLGVPASTLIGARREFTR